MVTSFIGVEHHFQQYVSYNLVTMLYADILLEVVFNTKNTGHHVIPLYARHIIGGGVQHQCA
jgi:hypothetical protein